MKSYGATASGCAAGVASNKGRVLVEDALGFYALADAVRGHPAGGRAAELTLERVRARILADGPGLSGEAAVALLRDIVQDCSQAVHAAGMASVEARGMCATLTLLWIIGGHAHVAHVGHGGLLMARLGRLHRLTREHSVAMELVALGLLEPARALEHPMAHVLTRAIGMQEAVLPDTLSIELAPGDRFILGDAGLDTAPDKVVEAMPCAGLARALVGGVLEGGRRDWTNAIVVEVLADAESGGDALDKVDILQGMFLFRDLDMRELARVLEASRVCFAAAGEVLIREGSQDYSLFLVLAGELEILKREAVLARVGRGGHVGEMALVTGAPRSASVRAAQDSRYLEISREHWLALLHTAPATGVKLLSALAAELSNRLAQMNERV